VSSTPSIPGEAPFDPATLARMANAMFAACRAAPTSLPSSLPGVANGLVPGAQALQRGAAGFAAREPRGLRAQRAGHADSARADSGRQRAAGIAHATAFAGQPRTGAAAACGAGNGVPDTVLSVAPAFEPRLGRRCWACRSR
jgi:cysteine desulfurase/selenocysteine lyase